MKSFWLLSAGIAALASPAHAQDQGSDQAQSRTNAEAAQASENDGQTIIVTAQGRRQILQDVPIAVSAVGAEQLQNSGANDIRQLNQLAPSLLVSSTGSEANGSARIRGIGTVGDNPGLESSVAVFIDGVYRSRSGIGLNELGEIDHVEVLRGPQGTLFGRNASAGLINIITRRPDFDFGGSAELTYGNYNYVRAAAGVTGPLDAPGAGGSAAGAAVGGTPSGRPLRCTSELSAASGSTPLTSVNPRAASESVKGREGWLLSGGSTSGGSTA